MRPRVTALAAPAGLIVNADDYGGLRCVSRGILEAAQRGIVTATGVIANRDGFAEQAAALRACPGLDTGVHLNLTWGRALTPQMRRLCARWGGQLPGKYALATAVLRGALGTADVEREWRAQVEACLHEGLQPRFLNSHEHVHMLPPLFGVATGLARAYGIEHVRVTAPDPARGPVRGAARARRAIVQGLWLMCPRRWRAAAPALRGLEPSGRLDEAYLHALAGSLRPGGIYELMCHPGHLDLQEVREPALLAYHDWPGELAALTSPRWRERLARAGVRLLGYRDLSLHGGRPVARPFPGTTRE